MMTAAAEREAAIRLLRWTLEVKIPHDLASTTHARRRASLQRQRAEARAELERLEAEEISPKS